MTITAQGNKVFKVHMNIIASQSKVFYNACIKDFKVSQITLLKKFLKTPTPKKEKKEANIDLTEQDAEAVEAVIEYLYKCDYTRLAKNNVDALVLHVHVHQLAHMYDINELQNVAASLFNIAAEKDWALPAFPQAIQEIYINPEDDEKTLRKLVVKHAVDNINDLLEDDDGDFAQTMSAFGEFGKDVSRALISSTGGAAKRGMIQYSCGCGNYFKINLRKASAAYRNNPKCLTQCGYNFTRQDDGRVTSYDQTCQTCRTIVSTSGHCSSSYILFCPLCNCTRLFKRA
jgi:hypothetical protein